MKKLFLAVCFSTLSAAPVFASELMNQGIAAFNGGDFASAVRLLEQAKKRDFENANLHYYLANALVKLKMNSEAVKEYKVALDLQPQGRLAEYCQAALKVLVPSASPSTSTTSTTTAKTATPGAAAVTSQGPGTQQPVVFSYLCNCPLCDRLMPILSDLHTKYGDKVNFMRAYKSEGNRGNDSIVSRYGVSACPTVLLFDNQGKMFQRYEKCPAEEVIRKDVVSLAATSNMTHLADTDDKHLAMSRKAIVDELNARISAGRMRLDQEVKMARREAEDELMANSSSRRSVQAISQARVDQMVSGKAATLKAEFDKQKKEWYAEAEQRLRGLGLKGSLTDIIGPLDDSD